MTTTRRPVPETTVPDDETPAARCPYCDRPFTAPRQCALHVGQAHPDAATAEERSAFEAAREEETSELFVYHLKVVAALGVIYAVSVVVYMVVLG